MRIYEELFILRPDAPEEEVDAYIEQLKALITSSNGTVDKVEKETMKSGVVYEAKVKGAEGQCSEIKVAEDGKLLKYKTWTNKCPSRGEMKHHDTASSAAK